MNSTTGYSASRRDDAMAGRRNYPKVTQSIDLFIYERNVQIGMGYALLVIACCVFWMIYDALTSHSMNLDNVFTQSALLLMSFSSLHVLFVSKIVKKLDGLYAKMQYYHFSYLIQYSLLIWGIAILAISNNQLIMNTIGTASRHTGVPLSSFLLVGLVVAPLPSVSDGLILLGEAIGAYILPFFFNSSEAYNAPSQLILRLGLIFAYVFFFLRNEDEYYTNQSLQEHQDSLNRANVITSLFLDTFDSVYSVDMKRDEFEIYRINSEGQKKFVALRSFSIFMDSYIREYVMPDDHYVLQRALDYSYIQEQFKNGRRVIIAQFRDISSGKPRYQEMQIVSALDGSTPDQIAVSFTDRDESFRTELERKQALQHALEVANQDALTRVKSRVAFAEAQRRADDDIRVHKQGKFAVVICDVNGLKEANDHYGHEAGDQLLIACSSTICRMFAHSPVYRIGGDEFAVILTAGDYRERLRIMNDIEIYLETAEAKEKKISFAWGMSEYMPESDHEFQDVFARADALMYAKKREMKQIRAMNGIKSEARA